MSITSEVVLIKMDWYHSEAVFAFCIERRTKISIDTVAQPFKSRERGMAVQRHKVL